MGITVKRPVTVKAIVTEEFRAGLIRELESAADQIAMQMQQMEFQSKRYLMDLQKRDLSKAMSTRRQFEEEKEKQEGTRREILDQIEQVKRLPLESEFVQGTLDSMVELEVGDNVAEKLGGVELVIRDNILVEIRECTGNRSQGLEPSEEFATLQPVGHAESVIPLPLSQA